MIARIKGQVIEIKPQQLIIDIAGLGYEVEVPLATSSLAKVNVSIELFTHFVVREDAQTLFGFLERPDRDLFRALIRVNKVGPKLALAILSSVNAQAFAGLVQSNEVKTLNRIPGVGRVMAERLIMEMRDKVDEWQGALTLGGDPKTENSALDDAETALVGLGYRSQEVSRVLAQIGDPADNVEGLIRQALKLLG
ncbi:MAG: Holliday junction branch migration protein RuvA [Pseudomonadales bacterium]